MSARVPQVGDKVVYTGEPSLNSDVQDLWDARRTTPHLVVSLKGYGYYLVPVAPEVSPFADYYVARADSLRVVEVATYERLPDPEPAYIVGEIYRCAHGENWVRIRNTGTHVWKLCGDYAERLEGSPARPLTRLVPEVTP